MVSISQAGKQGPEVKEGIFAGSFCGRARYSGNPYDVPQILGSNGVYGILTTVTLIVSNPTNKAVSNITGYVGKSSDIFAAPGCDAPSPPGAQYDYPFIWAQT